MKKLIKKLFGKKSTTSVNAAQFNGYVADTVARHHGVLDLPKEVADALAVLQDYEKSKTQVYVEKMTKAAAIPTKAKKQVDDTSREAWLRAQIATLRLRLAQPHAATDDPLGTALLSQLKAQYEDELAALLGRFEKIDEVLDKAKCTDTLAYSKLQRATMTGGVLGGSPKPLTQPERTAIVETIDRYTETGLKEIKAKKKANQVKRRWVTNGFDSKQILATDETPDGWRPGRVGAFGREIPKQVVVSPHPEKIGKIDIKDPGLQSEFDPKTAQDVAGLISGWTVGRK